MKLKNYTNYCYSTGFEKNSKFAPLVRACRASRAGLAGLTGLAGPGRAGPGRASKILKEARPVTTM